MPEPMSDERLAEIERKPHWEEGHIIEELLAEVRRLREERDNWREEFDALSQRYVRLRAELDAARRPSAVEELVAWARYNRADLLTGRASWPCLSVVTPAGYEALLAEVRRLREECARARDAVEYLSNPNLP